MTEVIVEENITVIEVSEDVLAIQVAVDAAERSKGYRDQSQQIASGISDSVQQVESIKSDVQQLRIESEQQADRATDEADKATTQAGISTQAAIDVSVIKAQIETIQTDVNEKASEVSSNTAATLQAKESVDQSLSTVLQAKDDVISLSTSTIANINNAGENALQYVDAAKDNALGEISPIVDNVTDKASQVTLDAEQVATDRGIVASDKALTQNAKTEAQTAAGHITDKIDFTGLKQGDILRYNGTKLVRISEVDFLKSKAPFQKSINTGMNDLNSAKIWDGFIREGTGPSIAVGVADSGQSYVQIEGSNVVNGGTDRKYLTGSGVVGIQNTALLNTSLSTGFTVEIGILANSGGNRYGLVMWVDSNNWLKMVVSVSTIYVIKKVSGIESIPFTLALSFNLSRITQNIIVSYSGQHNTISARHINTGQLVSPISCSDIISNGNDLTYIGLTGTITNWILFNQPLS